MPPSESAPASAHSEESHERKVQEYYDVATAGYQYGWSPDHLHFGIFEPGECPEDGDPRPKPEIFARALERMIETIVAPIGIKPADHVVDAGCGVGGTAIHLAKTFDCTVTGVNITESQLVTAREKVAQAGLSDRISFAWADCSLRLPFNDGSVDAVVNIESATYYSDRSRFLREVRRILKPEGRMGASDAMTGDNLSTEEYAQHITPICDAWAAHSMWDQATYTQHIQEAGLELVEFEGFHGKEQDNIRLMDHYLRALFFLTFGNTISSRNDDTVRALQTLYPAWRDGYFLLKRYCAMNPG